MGAVVARNGEVVAAAHNTRETEKNALHHAELLAIDAACKKLGGWRLWECELFVTLEPCPHVRRGPSSTAASGGWYTARQTPRRAAAAV